VRDKIKQLSKQVGSGRDVIVDGGLTWNFPVNLFDHVRYLSLPERGLPVSYAEQSGFVFTDFDLDQAQQEFLVRAGREGVVNFLKWYRSKSGQREITRIYRDMAPSG
jgi:hypothetical protein